MSYRTPNLLLLPMLVWLLAACGNSQNTQVVGILEWDRIELTAEANEPIIEILAHGRTENIAKQRENTCRPAYPPDFERRLQQDSRHAAHLLVDGADPVILSPRAP